MSMTQKEERRKHHHPLILLFETLLILVVFNASSYFGTTIYAKSIDFIGVALTIFLLVWIWVNSRFRYNYGMIDLGLTTRFVSRRQWRIIFAVARASCIPHRSSRHKPHTAPSVKLVNLVRLVSWTRIHNT